MQVLYTYYVKNHLKAMCGYILKFELNEMIIKQLINHLFHTFFTVISL